MSGKITRTQQIIDEANKLLNTDWSNEDKELVSRIIGNLKSYKSFIPSSLKDDIRSVLEMANRIKKEYDDLLIKFKEANNNKEEIFDTVCIEKELEELQELELKVEKELEEFENLEKLKNN